MQLTIQFPDTFALHGIERDAFEARLRDALHCVFDGSRVRQLAEQVNARRPFGPSDVLPPRRIGDAQVFEQCMTLDRCGFDDMSMALRRVVTHAIGARLSLELTGPGIAADIVGQDEEATNCLARNLPATQRQRWTSFLAGIVTTVVSMSPAQTWRDLTSTVPGGGRLNRGPVQVEPQGTDAGSH
ncbi:hypothetical protein AB4Y45_44510 [Paraburkholderia sp. EG287A]